MMKKTMRDKIRSMALQNAVKHGGKANPGPVIGWAMAAFPELKEDPKSASIMIREIVSEVNSMGIDEQESLLMKLGAPEKVERERTTGLPDLEGAEEGKVVMRFAPSPSGPLHIGHTRAAVLNDEYVKRYNGEFILRLEDTNPEKIDPDAYRMIPEDLDWLGITVHSTYIQSERMDTYYEIMRELLRNGTAYVCTCDAESWRDLKNSEKACPHREAPPEDQLELWDGMLSGRFGQGEASAIVKTDLSHPNPAVRDFVGMRIKDAVHPRSGDRYLVYPLYNLSVAIDDHLMGCTYVLRGKDHLNNTIRQEYVYRQMGWDLPHFIHYGLVNIPDSILKTSTIREEISKGSYTGWDDVRIGTLRALSSRGIRPESLRSYWKDVGVKPVDITFSWENLYSINRDLIDDSTDRFTFVPDPVKIRISSTDSLRADLPLHPDHPERGSRTCNIDPVNGGFNAMIPSADVEGLKIGAVIRLKDLCNVRIESLDPLAGTNIGGGHEVVRGGKGKILQWIHGESEECEIEYQDGSIVSGLAETAVRERAESCSIVQFERVGFCNLGYRGKILGKFAHR